MHSYPQTTSAYFKSGLPEIWGQFESKAHVCSIGYPPKGAFKGVSFGSGAIGNGTSGWDAWDFKASRCSEVYGRSMTVQPSAMTVNYFIRAK